MTKLKPTLATATNGVTSRSSTQSTQSKHSRREAKRVVMLAAAKSEFFNEGYAGASMDRVALSAGVSKATLYSYFGSKEELLVAVCDSFIRPFLEAYEQVAEIRTDFATWLSGVAKVVAQKAADPDTIFLTRIVIAESIRFPELGEAFERIAHQASLDLFRPRFEQAQRDGDLCTCDVDFAMTRFVEMCSLHLQRRLYARPKETISLDAIELHAGQVAHFFLNGFGPANAEPAKVCLLA